MHKNRGEEFNFDKCFPFDKYRNYQKETISEVIKAFESNKKYVILEAPTGIGKSAIAYTVGKYYLEQMDKEKLRAHKRFKGPPIIACTKTRQLQVQYEKSFNDLECLWSSKNYFCALEPDLNEYYFNSPACYNFKCKKMEDCVFLRDKQKFMKSDFGVLNYHYYIYSLYNDIFKPKLLIFDEAHNIENILCDIFTLSINRRSILKVLGNSISKSKLKPIENVIDEIIKTKDISTEDFLLKLKNFREMITEILASKKAYIDQCKEYNTFDGKIEDVKIKEKVLKSVRLISFLNRLEEKLIRYISGDTEWMISEQQDHFIKTKPLEIGHISDLLFRSSEKILFMSATICGSYQFCKDLNIEEGEYTFIETPSVIPVKNRKVLSLNVGTMNYKNKDKVFPKIIDIMDQMMDRTEKDKGEVRGIIHSVSYENASIISKKSKHKDRMLVPNRTDIMDIDKLLCTYNNTIVVSPSILEGVDLKDELSRFQFFPKVPYLSLQDKWVKAKMDRDSIWYARKAVMSIIQGSGRSIRTEKDWSITIIFDTSFRRLSTSYRYLFSNWFLEALEYVNLD